MEWVIHKPRGQLRGWGSAPNDRFHYISLFYKVATEREGVKIYQKFDHVNYGWPRGSKNQNHTFPLWVGTGKDEIETMKNQIFRVKICIRGRPKTIGKFSNQKTLL